MDRVNFVCILSSYVTALGLDLAYQRLQFGPLRWLRLAFALAGIVAQTIYLGVQTPDLSEQGGWLLGVAWVVALFYLFGTLQQPKLAWGIFALPLIISLIALSLLFPRPEQAALFRGEKIFAQIHKWLLLASTAGLAIGCLASVMYLVQAARLKAKALPGAGFRLLSAERLETMLRRSITWTFPLLTVGFLLGLVRLFRPGDQPTGWTDLRVLASAVFWLVFALLLYLRWREQLDGRRTAYLTILTFGLMLVCLSLAHPSGAGAEGQAFGEPGASATGVLYSHSSR